MKAFFHQLFDYNFHCNRRLIETCTQLKSVPEACIPLFSHILNAHHIWNARMGQLKSELEVWQLHDMRDWEALHYENQRTSFEIISNLDDFEKRIDYETTDGHLFSNSFQDILFHIINHSTHHRAQIVAVFRNHELQPPVLDYILYKR